MTEPILHEGQWWFQHENGGWSRWDDAAQQWIPYAPAAYYRTPTYSPLGSISRWVIVAIAVDMATSLVLAIIGLNLLSSDSRFASTDPEAAINDLMSQVSIMNLLNVVTYASGIMFIIWFYRAYQNLPALRTYGRYGTGWAIGAWLVPILNLFRPKQIADDIWRASDPSLPENPTNLWLSGKVAPIVHWWWTVWIVGAFAPLFAFPFMFAGLDPNDPGQFFARFFGVFMVGFGIGRVLSGALAIPVVKQMTERQERRAEALGVPKG